MYHLTVAHRRGGAHNPNRLRCARAATKEQIILVAIHDAEHNSGFPNFALMKISAWHKSQGHKVVWFCGLEQQFYDKIYSSKVFDFTPIDHCIDMLENDRRLIKGGIGYRLFNELPKEIDEMFPDYSIYPEIDHAIGFLTRGCIRKCEWCIVPHKEGHIKPYAAVEQIARQDTNKIVFMDNNVLACEHGIEQIKQIANERKYRIEFNQGLDVRLLTDEIIEILSIVRWIKHIHFSCDNESQLAHFEKWMPKLKEDKLANKMFVYLLVTQDIESAEFRARELFRLNPQIRMIYAQAEHNKGKYITKEQRQFCRYARNGQFRKFATFSDFLKSKI